MQVVDKVEKVKKGYNVIIDNKSYNFDEDTIVEYNLYKGKELNEDIISEIIKFSDNSKFYNMAASYAYRYGKNSKEVYNYLIGKEVDEDSAKEIVSRLVERKIINEKELIESIIYSLVRNYNGKKMILEKLKQKGFDRNLIEEEISNIDYDFYIECLNKLYEKIKNKYNKYDDYIRINKIKQYMYQRGYDYNDINVIDIK